MYNHVTVHFYFDKTYEQQLKTKLLETNQKLTQLCAICLKLTSCCCHKNLTKQNKINLINQKYSLVELTWLRGNLKLKVSLQMRLNQGSD